MQVPEDSFEDEEYLEEAPSFRESLYNHLASPIKQFLIDHLGDALNNAPGQTFRDIEQVIKNDISLGVMIPEHLYHYRTITDSDQWENAFENFKRDANAVFPWPTDEQWYNKTGEDEDGEADADESDLPADAQKIIDAADAMLDDHKKFKAFMQQCCAIIISETQLYLQKTAVFDLTILSAEGYVVLQDTTNLLAETLAEDLYAIVEAL